MKRLTGVDISHHREAEFVDDNNMKSNGRSLASDPQMECINSDESTASDSEIAVEMLKHFKKIREAQSALLECTPTIIELEGTVVGAHGEALATNSYTKTDNRITNSNEFNGKSSGTTQSEKNSAPVIIDLCSDEDTSDTTMKGVAVGTKNGNRDQASPKTANELSCYSSDECHLRKRRLKTVPRRRHSALAGSKVNKSLKNDISIVYGHYFQLVSYLQNNVPADDTVLTDLYMRLHQAKKMCAPTLIARIDRIARSGRNPIQVLKENYGLMLESDVISNLIDSCRSCLASEVAKDKDAMMTSPSLVIANSVPTMKNATQVSSTSEESALLPLNFQTDKRSHVLNDRPAPGAVSDATKKLCLQKPLNTTSMKPFRKPSFSVQQEMIPMTSPLPAHSFPLENYSPHTSPAHLPQDLIGEVSSIAGSHVPNVPFCSDLNYLRLSSEEQTNDCVQNHDHTLERQNRQMKGLSSVTAAPVSTIVHHRSELPPGASHQQQNFVRQAQCRPVSPPEGLSSAAYDQALERHNRQMKGLSSVSATPVSTIVHHRSELPPGAFYQQQNFVRQAQRCPVSRPEGLPSAASAPESTTVCPRSELSHTAPYKQQTSRRETRIRPRSSRKVLASVSAPPVSETIYFRSELPQATSVREAECPRMPPLIGLSRDAPAPVSSSVYVASGLPQVVLAPYQQRIMLRQGQNRPVSPPKSLSTASFAPVSVISYPSSQFPQTLPYVKQSNEITEPRSIQPLLPNFSTSSSLESLNTAQILVQDSRIIGYNTVQANPTQEVVRISQSNSYSINLPNFNNSLHTAPRLLLELPRPNNIINYNYVHSTQFNSSTLSNNDCLTFNSNQTILHGSWPYNLR